MSLFNLELINLGFNLCVLYIYVTLQIRHFCGDVMRTLVNFGVGNTPREGKEAFYVGIFFISHFLFSSNKIL